MILVGGTEKTVDVLPLSDVVDYIIENNVGLLEIKLKTVAKSDACLAVYLNKSLDGIVLPNEVIDKTIYFEDDDQLCRMLESGGNLEEESNVSVYSDVSDNVEESNSGVVVFSNIDDIIDSGLKGVISDDNLDEVDTSIPEDFLELPIIGQDSDSLKLQLEMKERIIQQKDAMLEEMKSRMDGLFRLQERELAEVKKVFETKLEEANNTIELLKNQIKEIAVPKEFRWIVRFATYGVNYKVALKEGFSEEELNSLGKLKSRLYLFAVSSGDSLYCLMKSLRALMDKGSKAIFVDFSNDNYLVVSYKLRTRDSSMLLQNDDIQVKDIVKDVGNGVRLIPTTLYNDIALLGMDWVRVLKKLDDYASGLPIVFIFNNINSFAVKYTVSKLATIGELFIFAKCNPLILASLHGDLAFIPENRFKVVAMEYVDVVKNMLEKISKKYKIYAFKDNISWSELGVRV